MLFLSTASPYCVRLSKHFELEGGKEDRYNALIKENELLFTADLVKGEDQTRLRGWYRSIK